jgi:hypothetical protein
MSIRDWFLAPPPAARHTRPDPGEEHAAEPAPLARDAIPRMSPPDAAATWAPPVEAAPAYRTAPGNGSPPDVGAPAGASPARLATPSGGSPAHVPAAWAPPVDAGLVRARVDTPPDCAAERSIASAAVIGRPGEAEPVAAGVALALRGPAAAAVVIVVGEPRMPHADGGTRAARRLAARLEAHGFEAAARGRLAWAYVNPDAARRAARVSGAPVVLAITAPLDLALELAISDQDLAIVVARDEHGPLAQLATATLACPDVTTTAPLPRGVSRLLALRGLRASGDARTIVHT